MAGLHVSGRYPFCIRRRLPASSTPQLERAWDAWQAERYQRGEISQRPGYTDNPFRPHYAPVPAAFRKLDALAVLTGPLLPAPRQLIGRPDHYECIDGSAVLARRSELAIVTPIHLTRRL